MKKHNLFLTFFLLAVLAVSLNAQTYKISGKLTDAGSGDVLYGANIYIPSLNMGAVSDFNGYYTIDKVPSGSYTIKATYIGYIAKEQTISVSGNLSLDFSLEPTAVQLEGVVVRTDRAKERETPVTFTELSQKELQSRYTTQDVPDLLKTVPGVFTSTAGLGESQIFIRGFDAEHIQILINGVPVNDPESQVVYWSNWTGLSSNATSIQVQRGVGASLVGSGSFGGSVNIQTSLYSSVPKFTFRGSMGFYTNRGVDGGRLDGKIADGTGGYQNYTPWNQNFSLDYTSGQMYDGKLNVFAKLERKAGDSYLVGSYYNGWAYYLGLQGIFGKHLLTFNAHGAPQRHNQARTSQDPALLDRLGLEYNRNNHPYQENYYYKPQFELHWDWNISDHQNLTVHSFFTFGTGGGRYLRNDHFDVNDGAIGFKNVDEFTDWKEFGRHARFIYETAGVVLRGYDPASKVYTYGSISDTVTSARNVISSQFGHSWRNDSQNHHVQVGANAAYQHRVNKYLAFAVGGESRYWTARHYAETFDFRKFDVNTGGVKTLNVGQRRYDYDGNVTNLSGFGRILVTPIKNLTVMLDGQYASSIQSIDERLISIYDFQSNGFVGASYYGTKSSGKFSDDDYKRTFSFFTPKIGANYNVNENINVFANYSVAKKEPKTGDWYDRSDGPGANNLSGEVKEETLNNFEIGIGYKQQFFAVNANFYVLDFKDKIESVTNQSGNRETINAGNAKHIGFELSATGRYKKFDGYLSISASSNKWKDLNVEKIFGEDAKDVVDKVVPFSPENIYHLGVGYNVNSDFRVGLESSVWNRYYGNYTNTAVLPNFFELNAVVSYGFYLNESRIDLRLDATNLTGREQFQKADWTRDFNRNDSLSGKYYMYILQSPLRSFFLTATVNI